MRTQLQKLQKRNSSKGERRLAKILERNRIKFKSQWRIGKYSADFVVGRLIIEIDGNVHEQTNSQKDTYFASQGYVTIHLKDSFDSKVIEKEIKYLIKANNLYQEKNG